MVCPTEKRFAAPAFPSLKTGATTQITKDELDRGRGGIATTSSTEQSFWLLDLPNEILSHIFTFLDSPCPSEVNFNSQPSKLLTRSGNLHLKSISTVSERCRSTALPLLFAHARLDPYKLTDFLAFVRSKQLEAHIKSVVAMLQGPCNHLHPAWWARLLNRVPATSFSIICAPHVFAELASISIVDVDSWAFNMPHQVIRFRQDPETARQHISLNDLPNLLTARPWTDFSVNEGSSLKAYTTYEYFLRRTPSLMATLHLSKSAEADTMFGNLTSFSFVAIFPFYNHVDEILKSVRKMKKLQKLSLKLCPEPESTVLADEIEEAQGKSSICAHTHE